MTVDLGRLMSEAQRWVPLSGRLRAIGLATVDIERAAGTLGLDVRPAPASALLGAHCRMASTPEGQAIALLEPATEGRLAAWLARHGEGLVAVWFSTDDGKDLDLGQVTHGPFGMERAVVGGASNAGYLFLLERLPATINE